MASTTMRDSARARSSTPSKSTSAAKSSKTSTKAGSRANTKSQRPPDSDKQALRAWLDAMPMPKVWEIYKKDPSEGMRNFLTEKYLHLVRYNAERIYTRLPDEVDLDDLMSVGQFGLMEAINAFDLTRGVKFETFCAPRIRGAILDELRSMDWVPRLVRHRSAKVNNARMKLEMELGRTPTEAEICARLGADDEELKKIMRDGSAVNITSLNRRCYQSDGSREVREIDVIEDGRQSNPLGEIQRRDLKELMTKGLSRAERLIVVLYYYEEMTMKEIGTTLDLSESRVSQMHSSILARLKAQLQHRTKEFEPVE